MIRIVSWNLGHQTHERPIPVGFLDAVKALSPDVLVLNEYVHGESRAQMTADLKGMGLGIVSVAPHAPGHNQVLIASRSPHSIGDLTGPATTPAATANFLHVVMAGTEVVGMRAPAYKEPEQLSRYWDETERLITGTVTRCIIFIGDMNCDPEHPRKAGGRALNRLRDAGWQVPKPEGQWSFISKNGRVSARIDHAICSPKVMQPSARYVTRIDGLVLAGAAAERAISDHAALVLELE